MSGPWRIARSWLTHNRLRTRLTTLTVALAASLVVFTVGGMRMAAESATGMARDLMGPFDLVVQPRLAIEPMLGADAATIVDSHPATTKRTTVAVAWGDIEDVHNTTYYESWRVAFLGTDLSAPVGKLRTGRWIAPNSESLEGVIDGGLARSWAATVGDVLPVHSAGGSFELTVVGITDAMLTNSRAAGVWVTAAHAERLAGGHPPGLRWYVQLDDEAKAATVAQELEAVLGQADPPARVANVAGIADEMGSADLVRRLRSMGGSAAAIAVLAALFLVHTTIATGAAERRRQIGILRSVGMSARQVRHAVLLEALAMGLTGGVAGVILGWLWLALLGSLTPAVYSALPPVDPLAWLAGFGVSAGTALVAAWGPARAATRIDPITAIAEATTPVRGVSLGLRSGIGIALLALAAVATPIGVGLAKGPMTAMLAGQLLALATAAMLCTPLALRAAEALLAPPLARLVRVPAPLLRQQLSTAPERNLGLVRTLAVCLGLSITMNVWGRSMVIAFLPSPDLPDGVASLMPAGVPHTAAHDFDQVAGTQPGRVVPTAVEQTYLAPDLMARLGGSIEESTVLVLGIDPGALTGSDPLLPVDLGDLNAKAAASALLVPGSVLVPPDLMARLRLQPGDTLGLIGLGDASSRVTLTVAGAAAIPGWHWVTKFANMRSLGSKPLAPVLVSLDTAHALGITRLRHIFMDLEDGAERQALRAELTRIAQRHAGPYDAGHFGPAVANGVTVKFTDTREVANRMHRRADSTIWVLGALPLAALGVAVLGIAGAIASGIRSRSFTFGIARAVGAEGRTTARMVLVEAMTLALAAGLLVLPLAIITAQAAIGIGLAAWGGGGGRPPLVIPWIDILIAILITVGAATLAAWGSARLLARRDPVTLLRAER